MEVKQIGQFVMEDYTSFSQTISASLNQISDFIETIERPYKERIDPLTNTQIDVAEIALNRFKELDSDAQKVIFHIIERLTEQRIEKCYDGKTRDCYLAILQLWARFDYLQTAIGSLSLFLTPARFTLPLSSEALNRSQCILAFAVKHFKMMDADSQMQINYLAQMVKIPPLPDLLKEPRCKRYQFLLNLLNTIPLSQQIGQLSPHPSSNPHRSQLPVHSPIMWKEPIPNPPQSNSSSPEKKPIKFFKEFANHFLPPELSVTAFEKNCVFLPAVFSKEALASIEASEEKEWEENVRTKQAQLKKICILSNNLCKIYFPLSWIEDQNYQQEFLNNFEKEFPPVAKMLFFNPPSKATSLQFQIIYNSLSQVVLFLKGINTENSSSPKLSKEELHNQLTEILKRLYYRWQPQKTPINELCAVFTVSSCMQMIKFLSNPDSFYFLLERLLSPDPFDLDDLSTKTIPLEMFSTHKKLTEQFGDILEELGKEFIRLGDPKWTAKALSKGLKLIVSFKKEFFAQKIQQVVHQIKNSPCSMKPILVLHHLFFRREKDILQATWFEWKNLDPEEKKKRIQMLECVFNSRLYQVIYTEIESQNRIIGWMADNADSIKEFCQTLSQSLWQTFRQEDNLKLLLLYLLRGVENALIKHEKT